MADKEALIRYFDNGFLENSLPPNPKIEEIPKDDIMEKLKHASANTQKGKYDKGNHSFKILGEIAPSKVTNASPFADRFIRIIESHT
jgi:hypothetical protein